MPQKLFRMDDKNPDGMFPVSVRDAAEWNQKGSGIFITVNSFRGARRMQNLEKIIAWAVDLDTGTKDEMAEKIKSGLTPSLVVESKRGFHVWFRAKNAEPAYWNAVMLDRLVPFYGADRNARDLCRVLRMPGYYHMKNPHEPFLVQKVFEWNVEYTQEQMASFYPDLGNPEREEFKKETREFKQSGDFWENVWRLDCMEGLERLSGTTHVNFESFSFKRNTNGKYNLYVDGRGTSVFIDQNMRIGSLSGGGPTLAHFLKWYGRSWKETIAILKEVFPEVEVKR